MLLNNIFWTYSRSGTFAKKTNTLNLSWNLSNNKKIFETQQTFWRSKLFFQFPVNITSLWGSSLPTVINENPLGAFYWKEIFFKKKKKIAEKVQQKNQMQLLQPVSRFSTRLFWIFFRQKLKSFYHGLQLWRSRSGSIRRGRSILSPGMCSLISTNELYCYPPPRMSS